MFRKGVTLTFSVLVLSVFALVAGNHIGLAQSQNQSVPNLGGTWELVQLNGRKKTKQTEAKFPRLILVIAQEGSQIGITQKLIIRGTETVQSYSFYVDGRGENNDGRLETSAPDRRGFESVSRWRKQKLVTSYDNKVRPESGGVSISPSGYKTVSTASRRSDEWRLSADGKSLVLTSSIVRMHSGSLGPGIQSDTGFSRTPEASYAEFSKNKLVFRKI
jgi:hypothetical protein